MTAIERRSAASPGGPVSYLVAGSGPTLVLVHGTGGSAESNWAHLIPELATTHRVIAPDLPGSGETALGATPLELDRLARTVGAALNAEAVADARIVGFSLGAVVAVEVAARESTRITSALLVGGWLAPDSRLVVQMELWQHLLGSDPAAASAFLTLTGFSPAFLTAMSVNALRIAIDETAAGLPEGMAAQAELDTRVDVGARARSLRIPVTVVGMTEDHMVPIAAPRALAGAIPGSSFVELRSGHLVIYELADQLTALIRGAQPTTQHSTKE